MKQINGQTIETELIITFSLPRIRMKHDDREKKDLDSYFWMKPQSNTSDNKHLVAENEILKIHIRRWITAGFPPFSHQIASHWNAKNSRHKTVESKSNQIKSNQIRNEVTGGSSHIQWLDRNNEFNTYFITSVKAWVLDKYQIVWISHRNLTTLFDIDLFDPLCVDIGPLNNTNTTFRYKQSVRVARELQYLVILGCIGLLHVYYIEYIGDCIGKFGYTWLNQHLWSLLLGWKLSHVVFYRWLSLQNTTWLSFQPNSSLKGFLVD